MGVPGFYSWLTKRYPMIKQMVGKHSLPEIDYLYLDMNGIIYKCVKDDSIIFKSQVMPKQLEEIWIQIFNYINQIVNLLKPSKMIVMALDGVAPRSKMNNQRARRFKSARDYKDYIEKFYGYSETVESQQNFKNNSISPGTKFMQDLNQMLHFFIQKKIQEDDYWKSLSVVFTGSDCPGEGEHKIMQFIRSNKHQFDQNDCHCLYGADADLIMLGLSLPLKNLCIIRQEYTHQSQRVKIMTSKKQKTIQFQMIFLTILRQYFDIEYQEIKDKMKNLNYSITKIIKDFVFLFFFIGNDFLPRCMAYNIRQQSIQKLIKAFKLFLAQADDYVVGQKQINMKQLARLCNQVSKYQAEFIQDKAQEAKKFLQKKVEFQDQFNQAMKEKVIKETQFLNLLKQFYLNQDQNIRAGFYRSKFNIDPAQNIQQFYSLLGFYLHGLKFVYQYYFLSLSSWSWYYPYYYAPLLSDLSFYLNYLAENNLKLHDLQLGQPFQPFKQLLCILPKQSNQLLPASFREYLTDQNSPLRNPVDFYPNHFEDDLYGSVRSHEAVSLIPFLNQQIIENVYNDAFKKVTPQQLRRNVFHKTRLYQYQEQAKQTQVKSPFEHIQSFSCSILIQDINLLQPSSWIHKSPITKDVNVLKMPTLRMKNIESFFGDKKGALTYYVKVLEEQIKDLKIGQYVFYGYPLQHSGKIQAILSLESFRYMPQFDPYAYRLEQMSDSYEDPKLIQSQKKKQLFGDLLEQFKKKFAFLDLRSTQQIAFVIDTQYFSRTLDGGFQRVFQNLNATKSYQILPVSLISRARNYATTKQNFHFSSIKQEFPLNQEVIFVHPNSQISGSKGKIVGYSNDDKKVKVKLSQQLKKYKTDNLTTIVNTNQVFLDIRFVSELIKIKFDILLTIIDTVSVQLPRQKNLPPEIDIGLNFISRHQNKLVPGLVRLNFESKQVRQNNKNRFKYLEMSIRAFQILLEYKTKYPEVLDFIKARHLKLVQDAKMNNKPINWRQRIKAQDIYRDDGKSQGKHNQTTRQLMKVYVWLIKKEETHLPVSSIYSKQISYKKISKLQEYFLSQRQKRKNKKPKFQESKQQQIDPNYLFSLSLAKRGTLYLSSRPKQHAIGDQVICLHPEYFGHFGVVIGVDDDKYQVIFQKPSFGKSDLGGLCQNLWGGKFKYKQIFNLEIWLQHFKQRTKTKSIKQNLGWIESQQEYYPKFKTNPIKNFNDFQKLLNNAANAKFFTQQIIQYIRKVKDDLKMVQIDPEYQVVDNRQQDYKYKYDNKQATVSNEQIEEISKNKKWIEKKIQATEKVEEFQQEVIQNKLEKLQIEDKKAEQFGQEQDAADILA